MSSSVRLLTGILALVWLTAARGALSAQGGRADDLPAGEGRETAIRICGDCHGVHTLDDLRKVPALDFARIQERMDRIGFSGP